MSAAKMTTDHEEIRQWVEGRGGHPATVKRTRSESDVGLLRIDFPGFSGERTLAPISWDDWFEKFDEQRLALLYQSGKNTRFNKLVRRNPDEVRPSDRRRGPSRTTRGGRAAARPLTAGGTHKTKKRAATKSAPRRTRSKSGATKARSGTSRRRSKRSA